MLIEQRQSTRKVLKVKAMLALEGAATALVRTIDLGSDGMAVASPDPLPQGATGRISFSVFLDGKPTPISARSRITYCIFSHGEFKAGLQFLNLELGGMAAVAKFLR